MSEKTEIPPPCSWARLRWMAYDLRWSLALMVVPIALWLARSCVTATPS